MLTGTFCHALDEKNRLSIPSKWRKDLEKDGKEIYVTPGLDQCLFILSSRQFEELAQKVKQLPFTKENVRSFSRLFFSKASPPLEFDKQGRILIPLFLKDHAEINKEIVLVGVYDRIEAWNPKLWDSFNSQKEGSFEKIAETLF